MGRRSHRKSRAGCLQCKKRKVKPSQPGPSSFQPSGLPSNISDYGPSSQDSSASPRKQSQYETESLALSIPGPTLSLLNTSSELAVLDLELLHHYTTSTCYTLSRAPAVQAIWRDEAPRVGFSMPFVLHALLAISALHLARSNPSRREECICRAQRHHEAAVRTVAPVVPSLAADNCVALFLFAALTCLFSCAKPPGKSDFLVLFQRGRISEWVRLTRGNKAIINCHDNDLRTGTLQPLFVNGSFLAARSRDSHALEQGRPYVWELRQMIREQCLEPSQLQVYMDTLDELSRTLATVMRPGGQWRLDTADVFSWLLQISDEYLELLRQEAPIALIVFAYFCVSLRQIEWMWWMEGLSERLMSELCSALDEKYWEWLRWPQEQICRGPGS
ncbi:hypothetical protein FE257_006133 [Aspergillus nanangensis]|uniref:Uncharacterized protein n=1 Tax=Aspergillus nanangensis TaxID=2582783 RepID=A0AAD4CPD2_ASPNN|nr:hypothetical protein FE257_006133 [Aspergillus nanangensis]